MSVIQLLHGTDHIIEVPDIHTYPGNSQACNTTGGDLMQDILTCVMGLDVHRDIIVACLVKGAVDAEPEAETRTFSTLIPEMQKLRDWVIESECRNIAMESTGIYWQPIYEMLESCFDGEISILVVNAEATTEKKVESFANLEGKIKIS